MIDTDARGVQLGWAQDGMGDWWYVDAGPANPATHVAHLLTLEAQKHRLDCIAPVIADANRPAFDRADYVLRVLGLTA